MLAFLFVFLIIFVLSIFMNTILNMWSKRNMAMSFLYSLGLAMVFTIFFS